MLCNYKTKPTSWSQGPGTGAQQRKAGKKTRQRKNKGNSWRALVISLFTLNLSSLYGNNNFGHQALGKSGAIGHTESETWVRRCKKRVGGRLVTHPGPWLCERGHSPGCGPLSLRPSGVNRASHERGTGSRHRVGQSFPERLSEIRRPASGAAPGADHSLPPGARSPRLGLHFLPRWAGDSGRPTSTQQPGSEPRSLGGVRTSGLPGCAF